MWWAFNWRFDSGLVAGIGALLLTRSPTIQTVACANTSTTLNGQPAVVLSGLTADEQFEAGLTCGGLKATPTTPLPSPCLASEYGSTLLRIPAPGTGD